LPRLLKSVDKRLKRQAQLVVVKKLQDLSPVGVRNFETGIKNRPKVTLDSCPQFQQGVSHTRIIGPVEVL
jgi:hypothetical protein